MHRLVLGGLLAATTATTAVAGPRAPALDALAGALPAGWTMATTTGELELRRTQPVRIGGKHVLNAPHTGNLAVSTSPASPTTVLRLRFRIEPAWSAARRARARRTNATLRAELAALRARHRIDTIPHRKGRPRPVSAGARRRLAAFEADAAALRARLIALPRCTLGALSVFDEPDTYAQLDLVVEPATAMREAYAVVELLKRRCR